MSELASLLRKLPVASPFAFAPNSRPCLRLDLGAHNAALRGIDPADTAAFSVWIDAQIAQGGAYYAAGGYAEDRQLYAMSPVFAAPAQETRTVHLGIDLWLAAGTAVHAVLDGSLHSLRDNQAFGDYGPTLVFEHHFEGLRFYTLYGHLARASLTRHQPGERVRAGDAIGTLGDAAVNGGWPPHLHFQVMREMDGPSGDHPGVCKPSEQAHWLAQCADPNLLLRIAALDQERTTPRIRPSPVPR